jgi:branched-chain amino acid transport system ATP-binding protein
MADAVLRAEGVSVRFGGVVALDGVSISIKRQTVHGLIGPNGAGKTTLFNVASGFIRPDSGDVFLGDDRITAMAPHQRCDLGIGRTFQNIRLFASLSVIDNILVGMHCRGRAGTLDVLVGTRRSREESTEARAECARLLELTGLHGLEDVRASSLPYGLQRRVEIARALATKPRMLLLDEPSAGMNFQEKNVLRDFIKSLTQDFDLTILVIEHNMKLVMSLCDPITVLDHGQMICEGSSDAVQADPRVIEAYLGKESEKVGSRA